MLSLLPGRPDSLCKRGGRIVKGASLLVKVIEKHDGKIHGKDAVDRKAQKQKEVEHHAAQTQHGEKEDSQAGQEGGDDQLHIINKEKTAKLALAMAVT